MKVAIVHDWLVTYAGSERVLSSLLKIFPGAAVFSMVDFLPEKDRGFLANTTVSVSALQKFPFARRKYRNYLPLMPLLVEQFDLSGFDLVISSSHAVAKGIITGPGQIHICYCHSPMRYAWDLQAQYLRESGMERGMKSALARYMLHKLRLWDVASSKRVDHFVANSNYISQRIEKVYRRTSKVIYPPVAVEDFDVQAKKKDYYLTASRMVPYKKMDLIVEAFNRMPNKKLVVIGDGPMYPRIKEMALANVSVLGYQSFDALRAHMQDARAFVFAAEEDFGIIPVEAQACGTPVIAYGRGGALETVVDGKTGVLFPEQTADALVTAVRRFETDFQVDASVISRHAALFSTEVFLREFSEFVRGKIV